MEAKRFNRLLKNAPFDTKAFDELYRFYYRRVVFRLSGTYGRELAEDAAQDFFRMLITRKTPFDRIEKPASWVYTCCENIAKNKIKSDAKYVPLSESAAYADGRGDDGRAFYEALSGEVGALIEKLDDASRQIVLLHYWAGYSQKEIAEMLNMEYSAVRKRLARARDKLKKFLD